MFTACSHLPPEPNLTTKLSNEPVNLIFTCLFTHSCSYCFLIVCYLGKSDKTSPHRFPNMGRRFVAFPPARYFIHPCQWRKSTDWLRLWLASFLFWFNSDTRLKNLQWPSYTTSIFNPYMLLKWASDLYKAAHIECNFAIFHGSHCNLHGTWKLPHWIWVHHSLSVKNNNSPKTLFLDFFLAYEQNSLIQNLDCYESMQCTICPIKFSISPGSSHTIKLPETIEFWRTWGISQWCNVKKLISSGNIFFTKYMKCRKITT